MERFLAGGAAGEPLPRGPVEDPIYRYGTGAAAPATHDVRPAFRQRAPRQRPPRAGAIGIRQTKRPVIWRDLVGRGVSLDITMDGTRYLLPHDEFVEWVRQHMTALETASWKKQGLYSWPRATRAMMKFLRKFEVQKDARHDVPGGSARGERPRGVGLSAFSVYEAGAGQPRTLAAPKITRPVDAARIFSHQPVRPGSNLVAVPGRCSELARSTPSAVIASVPLSSLPIQPFAFMYQRWNSRCSRGQPDNCSSS